MTAREGAVLRNATTQENLGEHNFMKGEATGMRALLALPNTIIEEARNLVDQLEQENDDETPE